MARHRLGNTVGALLSVCCFQFASLWLGFSIALYPVGILLAFVLVWNILRLKFTTKEEENVVDKQPGFARMLHVLVIIFAGNFTALLAPPESDFARITSLNGVLTPVWAALTFSGLLWAVWARWTMGSEWRGTPEVRADHRLITSGPFRYTRHPIYTGVYFIMLGNALYGGHWLALLMAGVIIGTYEYKIGVEERMLTKHFGSKYVDYQKRTPRIVPFCNFF